MRRTEDWNQAPKGPLHPALSGGGCDLDVGSLRGPRHGHGPACNGTITQRQRHSGNTVARLSLTHCVSIHLPSPDTTGPVLI